MKKTTQQQCPLCSSEAEYYRVDYGIFKYFKCSTCTYFQISDRAEKLLQQAPEQWRSNYSAKAKLTPEEQFLVITTPSAQPESGAASVAVSGQYRPKSELSL